MSVKMLTMVLHRRGHCRFYGRQSRGVNPEESATGNEDRVGYDRQQDSTSNIIFLFF